MTPIDSAAQALNNFASGPGADAANGLADVFEQAGDRIANSLEQAARSGELSFNALAEGIANDFARFAVDQLITVPLEGLVSSLTRSFAGTISGGGSPVTVNLNMPQGVASSAPQASPQASGAQIAARVAQAVTQAQTRTGP